MGENGKSVAVDWLNNSGEMGKLIRSKDWSKTPLGPIESWPQSLRTTVSLCLASNFPINIIWGPERVQIYNDGYWSLCGDKHPHSMGQDFQEGLFSAWDALGEAFESASAGETAFLENRRMFLDRNGYLEETFFTFSFSPIRDETGGVGGLFHPVTELTQQTLIERRLKVLRDLAERTADAKTIEEACGLSAQALAAHELDLPFTLFYRLDPDGKQAYLVSMAGLKPGSAACPTVVDLEASPELWPFAEVARSSPADQRPSGQARQVDELEQRFGPLECSPYPESPKSAIVIPIALPGLAHPWGVFIAGVSPRRALDEPYQTFYTLLGKSVTTAIINAHTSEEARKRAEALAELDRAKTAFFSNISHEFRTPLTLMLSPLEDTLALPDDELLVNHRQSLKVVHRNGLRLLKLVNTLLEFSRIEAGRVQAVYKPTDLAKLTTELASVFRSAIEQAGLTLIVDCPSDFFSAQVEKDLTPQPHQEQGKGENSKPSQEQQRSLERGFPESTKSKVCSPLSEPVYVDRDMWEKIVLNLLSNAFKFTFAGQITVRLRQVNNQAELTVQDTGVGIPEAELPRVFERFHRVSGTRSRSHEGSGIGLSLMQELVKLHGGTIEVSSQVDLGTTFTVAIPLGKTHLSSAHLWRFAPKVSAATPTLQSTATDANIFVEEALRWLPEEEQGERRSTGSRGRQELMDVNSFASPASPDRILVVDDNADMREYLQHLLSKRWQVKAVENGAVALALMQNWMPDLILSDVMMPELDGFGLLQAIRANPYTKGIPVILLSARAGEEAAIEGLETGADDYLIKPFSARELMTRVNTNLQMARLRQERSANRLKDEFLATLTHEMNAPLAAILTWARLLQTKPFDRPMTLRALEAIERNASNLAKLIEDLLDMSSILAGKRGLNSQPVDLVAIMDDVLNTLYPTAQAKVIALTYGIDDSGLDADSPASQSIKSDEQLHNLKSRALLKLGGDLPASRPKIQNPKFVVSGEPKRLGQIIANLLSNAIKFTPIGGKIAIQLGVEKHEAGFSDTPSHARIQIKDTGIGISADFLPYVFDRFRQAEVPSRHSPGGVGLGLAIARHLVELHGGAIEVASEGQGRGTTFTVRLPIMNPTELNSNVHTQKD